tara:strand:+ start:25 stop:288 length:264 start_codon:yes stop_codon:yes gene_type:complete
MFRLELTLFYFCIYLYKTIIKYVMAETKLTTVKIVREVYAEFKRISFDSNITFQKLVNRSLHKYINDTDYKDEINNYTKLQESGSQF